MSDSSIVLEDGTHRGQYTYRRDGQPPAKMTFQRHGSRLIIDHTLVPPSYRGHGVALQLVTRAVEDARENGWTLQPVCSYVVAQFEKHPEWADVLAD